MYSSPPTVYYVPAHHVPGSFLTWRQEMSCSRKLMILSPLQLSSHCILCPYSPCPRFIPNLKARNNLQQKTNDSVPLTALIPSYTTYVPAHNVPCLFLTWRQGMSCSRKLMILSPLQLSFHCILCPCSPCPLFIPDLKAWDELLQKTYDSFPFTALLPLYTMSLLTMSLVYSWPEGKRWAGAECRWFCRLCSSPPTPPPWGVSHTRRGSGSEARSS